MSKPTPYFRPGQIPTWMASKLLRIDPSAGTAHVVVQRHRKWGAWNEKNCTYHVGVYGEYGWTGSDVSQWVLIIQGGMQAEVVENAMAMAKDLGAEQPFIIPTDHLMIDEFPGELAIMFFSGQEKHMLLEHN
jgi:hypothetical protein